MAALNSIAVSSIRQQVDFMGGFFIGLLSSSMGSRNMMALDFQSNFSWVKKW
jgi:NO-binding membrane sensor protein with MHYT domain